MTAMRKVPEWFLLPRRRGQTELQEIAEELRNTRLALRQTYRRFDLACDPLLIEASIYELKALQARHAYLLRRVKEAMAAQRTEGR